MKSKILYVIVITMLLVPVVTFGEIIFTGDWDNLGGEMEGDTWYSSGSAYADGDGAGELWMASGWEFIYTTEAGEFDWEYYIYTWTEAHLWIREAGNCIAEAYATASADDGVRYQHSLTASACIFDSEGSGEYPWHLCDWDDGFRPWPAEVIWKFGWWDYYPNEGVSADHFAGVAASVNQYSDNEAFSHVCARASANLDYH